MISPARRHISSRISRRRVARRPGRHRPVRSGSRGRAGRGWTPPASDDGRLSIRATASSPCWSKSTGNGRCHDTGMSSRGYRSKNSIHSRRIEARGRTPYVAFEVELRRVGHGRCARPPQRVVAQALDRLGRARLLLATHQREEQAGGFLESRRRRLLDPVARILQPSRGLPHGGGDRRIGIDPGISANIATRAPRPRAARALRAPEPTTDHADRAPPS